MPYPIPPPAPTAATPARPTNQGLTTGLQAVTGVMVVLLTIFVLVVFVNCSVSVCRCLARYLGPKRERGKRAGELEQGESEDAETEDMNGQEREKEK